MVKEHLFGLMEENIMENIKTIKKKVTVYLNGFENLIFRNDGRKYKGKWKNGKQHGSGEFFHPKENSWKKGIWNEGKRVRWTQEDLDAPIPN